MVRDVNEILQDTIAIAEEQVESARQLDAGSLNESTGFREHLLVELEQAVNQRKNTSDSTPLSLETEELVFQLAELDTRLETLLGAGIITIEKLRGDGGPDTYTFEGRLKRSTP
jgi:hypothetical protein